MILTGFATSIARAHAAMACSTDRRAPDTSSPLNFAFHL
jgi:hypothetical protein